MLRAVLIALVLILASPAYAQATLHDIATETRVVDLPGPRHGEERRIYVWAPPEARGTLPVLYVADGVSGIMMVLAHLRAPMREGRVAPLLIIGLEASPNNRREEYALGARRNSYWERHHDWFIGAVLPWAEANVGASTHERGVAGFSNGGDWALATAARRPDLFTRVLAHSPVNPLRVAISDQTQGRWVLSGGRRELDGEVVTITNNVARALNARPIRQCVGPWGHTHSAWTEITPGAVVWLYQLGDAANVETATERAHCRMR